MSDNNYFDVRHMAFQHLANLHRWPNFSKFREAFETAMTTAEGEELAELKQVGAAAFESLLNGPATPQPDVLRWFAERCDEGHIGRTPEIEHQLYSLHRRAVRESAIRREAGVKPDTVVQTKRVVQQLAFRFGEFRSSDALEIKRSVYRSAQERAFCEAARLRFPGLMILPNYPLHGVTNLKRIRGLVPDRLIDYGYRCSLDVVLITPREGDLVAAVELDSKLHENARQQELDSWKNDLLKAMHVPLFRFRSEDPTGTSVDEWYALLTDEVLPDVSCGERLRTRDVQRMLIPILGNIIT